MDSLLAMKLKPLLLFSVSLFFIAAIADQVKGCQCKEYGTPICAAFWRADAVFVGQMTGMRVEKADPNSDDSSTATWHFIVEQPFRGITTLKVDVTTSYGSSCDVRFQKGRRYLVYASLHGNQLFAGACMGTASLEEAVDELNYIRAATQQGVGESISGRIIKDRYEPVPQLNIQVTGGGKTWETSTDAQGDFSVSLPGPGVYKVRAAIPFAAAVSRYEDDVPVTVNATDTLTTLDYEITLEKNHCDYQELDIFKDNLHATAQLTGQVLTASGTGLDKGLINLVKSAQPEDYFRTAQLGADGLFKFGDIAPGEYYIVLNRKNEAPRKEDAPYPRTYYPGVSKLDEATKVVVAEGAKLEHLDLRLGEPFTARTISGTVEWPNGRRAKGSDVKLYTRDSYLEKITVEQDGTFSFQVYGDFEYEIQAETWKADESIKSQRVRLTPDKSRGLKLVLRR